MQINPTQTSKLPTILKSSLRCITKVEKPPIFSTPNHRKMAQHGPYSNYTEIMWLFCGCYASWERTEMH
ncbi:hypothetical protein CMV_014134 [Castanea mollissima]|uniref:Uncharacterized protein n=1 Tax=Castanea mollissima TaxID=60419 RepID=A0A8J4R664_9ROSI|nr:hypothetical protein CMV_014134 [Castanea mollissima]